MNNSSTSSNTSSQPLVSVIITTYNSADFLEALLQSIKKQTHSRIEIIVVDNNSKDRTKEIAGKFTDRVYNQGPERSAQRNFGAHQAQGDYLLVLDSDMVLSEGVVAACVEEMQDNSESSAIIIPERSFGKGFWTQCKILERTFYEGVDWMEGARFFRKDIFLGIGGYDENITGPEDFDLPQRIRQKHGARAIGRVDPYIFHNERRLSLLKTCRKKFYYAQNLDQYKKQNNQLLVIQANPLKRYKLFFSQPGKLIRHPVIAAGMLFMKTCELGSGGLGYLISQIRKKISK